MDYVYVYRILMDQCVYLNMKTAQKQIAQGDRVKDYKHSMTLTGSIYITGRDI